MPFLIFLQLGNHPLTNLGMTNLLAGWSDQSPEWPNG
jgi:hypothetical protein